MRAGSSSRAVFPASDHRGCSPTTRVREPASLHPASRCRIASSSSCTRVHDPAPLIPREGSSCARVHDPAPLIPRGGSSWLGYAGR
ncbi:hypothetical protein F2Q68_00007523 [Brassica cretica]|uniref:Uncharacterized protein n=1 Tax=Brassica cretica TaxID=69181 RepID=A0A8S9KXH7_BRACR|nr:hypothetical protein F2Q68_00007523 [Brassica cretica]